MNQMANEAIRQHALEMAGVSSCHTTKQPSLESLSVSEWSSEFERFMRNRLILGAMRYGRLGTRKPKWKRIESAISRLTEYQNTGNQELLVDVANLCLLEFVEGEGHWSPTDEREHVAKGD